MFKDSDKRVRMMSLGNYNNKELKSMNENKIEYRKIISKIMSSSRKESKGKTCFYCKEEGKKFCNSHSIPAMFLRNIGVNGYLYSTNIMINIPLIDEEIGVNKTGVFHIICSECDSKVFSDYENPENYKDAPTTKMIAQIAMKNFLKGISKRKFEIAFYDNIDKELGIPLYLYKEKQLINQIDLEEYKKGFERAKRVNKKDWEGEYYLVYHKKLPYVVPLAFQDEVTLQFDLEDKLINDIYYTSPKYRMQSLHICIFPHQKTSTIIMFIDSKNKRYRQFNKQFRKLEDEDKLSVINYIIFSLSEDVYLSKEINDIIINDENLRRITSISQSIISKSIIENPNETALKNLNLSKRHDIPNLLSRKYKVDVKT